MEEFDPDDEGYWKMEEFEDYSNSYECNGKLSRIWRNGVNLGKKMVITGVVVSSAPFVLPPLVALSAIGVAFSVPAGFVFASYACGEKLMNTLLPISNPYEENGIVICDDGQCMGYRDDVEGWCYEGDKELEVEEHEFEEDVKKELEMRIEFVEENNEGFDDHDGTPGSMEKRSSNVSEIIEEGYGDNGREYVAEEEQPMDSKAYCELLGGSTEVKVATELSLMEKEGVRDPRVDEIVEVEYEDEVGEYMVDEERPIDAEIPKILEEVIKEAEDKTVKVEYEEVGECMAGEERPLDAEIPKIFEAKIKEAEDEVVEVEYEEVGEYMENEEQPIDVEIPRILEGMIKEAEDEIFLMEKEESRLLSMSEKLNEQYEEDVGEYILDEEQPVDVEATLILEGVEEVENDISLMEKEDDRVTRVSEIAGDEFKEDVGEYMKDEEQPLDTKENLEILEGTEEAEREVFLMEKEEGRMPEVSEIVDEGYEENVEEYMENEEQPLDAKEIPDILEGIKEAENEMSLKEKKEGQGIRLSEVAVDRNEEHVGEYIVDEEQFLDAKEIPELLEGMKEAENVNSLKKDSQVPGVSEIGEEEFEDVGEYMPDEEQPLDANAIREILKETEETASADSLMEKEEVEMPRDSLTSVAAQLSGENEINVVQVAEGTTFVSPRGTEEDNEFAGMEEDKLRVDSTNLIEEERNKVGDDQKRKDSLVNETSEGNEESGVVPVKDLSQDKGNKNLNISKEVEPAIDDEGPENGLESENNVEQVTEDISFLQPRNNINEGSGFSDIEPEELRSETTGLIEKLRDEGKVDEKRNDNPVNETAAGNEVSGIASANEMSQNYGKRTHTIPEVVEPVAARKGVISSLKNENNVEQVAEDMAFVPLTNIEEENSFAVVEEEELRHEMTKLIGKMRDERSADQKRKDSATSEEHAEPRRVSIEPMSEDKESTSLTVIPKGLKPATNDKGDIFDLKNEVNLESTSIEQDEPRSAVENQLVATMKTDDHTVTEVNQGISSEKPGNLILSNEDTRETTIKSGFVVMDNQTMMPHQIVDSSNKMVEGEDQSSNKKQSSNSMVKVAEVSPNYHEAAIKTAMPASGLLGDKQSHNNMDEVTVDYEIVIRSALPVSVSEPAETAKDQGTTSGSDKVKQEEEKVWEDINAMRTIVGYTNAPHLSCAEELKALYDFTGVELPTSSNDSSDLADIKEKLHFLMSIIGVK